MVSPVLPNADQEQLVSDVEGFRTVRYAFTRMKSFRSGIIQEQVRRLPAYGLLLSFASPLAAEMTCALAPFEAPSVAAQTVLDTKTVIAGFEGLEATLTSHVKEICYDDALFLARGYFEPETRRIVLATDMSLGLQRAVVVHELRHAEQHVRGLCPSLTLDMKQYAHAVFAMEADASVTSLVVAAKHRANGDGRMWDALAAWPMQRDLAQRFEDALERTDSMAEAAQIAFEAWFEREDRTHAYYASTCLEYLDETEKQHLLPQYNRLQPAFLDQLCTLPDGSSYPCALPE